MSKRLLKNVALLISILAIVFIGYFSTIKNAYLGQKFIFSHWNLTKENKLLIKLPEYGFIYQIQKITALDVVLTLPKEIRRPDINIINGLSYPQKIKLIYE
uniref:Uncharacterized protein n=1 Tax=viral metagenome TaxID=1070528 RepID=A0A6M3LIH4_9ZZZZ